MPMTFDGPDPRVPPRGTYADPFAAPEVRTPTRGTYRDFATIAVLAVPAATLLVVALRWLAG